MTRTGRLAVAMSMFAWTLGAADRIETGVGLSIPNEIDLSRLNLQRAWHAQVPLLKVREKLLSIKVREGLLFATTDMGLLHCLDAKTGALRWTQNISAAGVVFPPAITEQYVYVATKESISQLTRSDGRILWTAEIPTLASAGPGANEDYVYVPAVDGRIYAFNIKEDPDTLKKQWPMRRNFDKHFIKWYYTTGAQIENEPVVLTDRVIFAASDGIVYAATLDKGKLYYRFYTNSTIAAPISSLDRFMYIATSDYEVFSVDMKNGKLRWRFLPGYPVYEKPIPFAKEVYITPQGAGLFSIDAESGRAKWQNPYAVRLVAVSRSHCYAYDRMSRLLILSREDGHKVGHFDLQSFTVTCENQFNDRIYVATPDGIILCMHEVGQKEPHLHPQQIDVLAKAKEGKPKDKKSGFFDDVIDQKDKPPAAKKATKAKVKKADDSGNEGKAKAKPKAKPGIRAKLKAKVKEAEAEADSGS